MTNRRANSLIVWYATSKLDLELGKGVEYKLYHRMPLDRTANCDENAEQRCRKKDIVCSKMWNKQAPARYIHARLAPRSQLSITVTAPHTYLAIAKDFAQGATVTGAGHAPRGPRDHHMNFPRRTGHDSCVYHRATLCRGQKGAVGKTEIERTCNGEKTQYLGRRE